MPEIVIVNSKTKIFIAVIGGVLLGLGAMSGTAVWFLPFVYTVKAPELLGHWWIYVMPGIPLTFGLWMLFKAEKWASTTLDMAEEAVDKFKNNN